MNRILADISNDSPGLRREAAEVLVGEAISLTASRLPKIAWVHTALYAIGTNSKNDSQFYLVSQIKFCYKPLLCF